MYILYSVNIVLAIFLNFYLNLIYVCLDHPRNGEAEQGVDVHSVIRVLRWVFRTNEKVYFRIFYSYMYISLCNVDFFFLLKFNDMNLF